MMFMKQTKLERIRVVDLLRMGKRYRADFTLSLVLLVFLAALLCSAFSSARPPIILTAANNGTVVAASVGTQIIVQLADNSGSTGYAWSFVAPGKHVVGLQSTKYLAPTFAPGSPPRLGAAGLIEFTFVAQNNGNTPLQFVLRRPWETNVSAAQRFGVVIHVAPAAH
jgi:predicted secreted protein